MLISETGSEARGLGRPWIALARVWCLLQKIASLAPTYLSAHEQILSIYAKCEAKFRRTEI